MHPFRALIRNSPHWAALIVAAALALRVLVPGGYMPALEKGQIVVKVCNGSPDGPGSMVITIPGLEHEQQPGEVAQGKCAYADLAQAMTGGPDPVLLAAAIAFALALALLFASPMSVGAAAFLRPPLRGPPARA